MNLATGSMTFGRNHRFVFGGLIAALSTAVILTGIAVWQIDGTGSSATAVEPVAAPAAIPAVETAGRSITPTFYYLVDSQAQAEMILQADYENQTYAGPGTEMDHTTYVIDISTPEGQQQAWVLNGELQQLMMDNPGFDAGLVQVHNLTAGAGLTNTPARSSFVPSDVPAGSTYYIVASEAEKQALLQSVDEASGFENIEYVEPNVIVIDPLDQEFLQLMVGDQMQFGTFDIVDLRSGSPAVAGLSRSGATVPAEASTLPLVVVVGSQEQADALQAQITADEMVAHLEGRAHSMPKTSFLVIDSPDKERIFHAAVADQMEFGTFDIVDLR